MADKEIPSEAVEDAYVDLSQKGASLVHHVSTPIAIARANVDFIKRYLDALIDEHQSTAGSKIHISEEHTKALQLAPELIAEQLEIIQQRVNEHWRSVNQKVSGKVPDFQVSAKGDSETLHNLVQHKKNGRILLVEDEAIHRDIALKVLSPIFNIDIAESGEDALEKCANSKYDLILLDVYLPGINGPETAKRIRQTVASSAIIVGLTNMPLETSYTEDFMNAQLSKPLTLEALDECLTKLEKISN